MKRIDLFRRIGLSGIVLPPIAACAPGVGSERWCANMKAKPKSDWTANEAVAYTKHCILE